MFSDRKLMKSRNFKSKPDSSHLLRIVTKVTVFLIPIFVGLTVVVLFLYGYTGLATVGLYAVFAVIPLPLLYKFANEQDRPNTASVDCVSNDKKSKKILLVAFLLALSISILFSTATPRPRIFFMGLAIAAGITFLYAVAFGRIVLPTLFSATIAFIFHLSTTLTKSFFAGSGDTIGNQISAKNLYMTGDVSAIIDGYSAFPLSFIGGVTISRIASLNSSTGYFLWAAIISCTAILSVYFLCRNTNIVPRKYAGVFPVLMVINPVFLYLSLISIPRTQLALLYVLPTSIFIGALLEKRIIAKRILFVISLILLVSIKYHKIKQIWLIILVAYLVIGLTFTSKRLIYGYKRQAGLGILLAFTIGYIYVSSNQMAKTIFVYHLGSLSNAVASGPERAVTNFLSKPIGVLTSFLPSSVFLLLFLIAVLKLIESGPERYRRFALLVSGLSLVYFPGPMYLSSFLSRGIQLIRFREILLPIIVLVCGYSIYKIDIGSDRPVQILLFVLIVTSGVFAFSSDQYSRDNPIAESGQPTNYMTTSEMAAVSFGLSHIRSNITMDAHDRYLVQADQESIGWGHFSADAIYARDPRDLSSSAIIIREQEFERRGRLEFFTFYIDSIYEVPEYHKRNVAYSSGTTRILTVPE